MDPGSELDDVPWVVGEHRPPPKPKGKKKKRIEKDLNQGKIPTAYRIRVADDGTRWHSIIDILRPDSPPVEFPEYPDKPEWDDMPEQGSDWDRISDPEDDPVQMMKNLGIPESRYTIDENAMRRYEKKLKKYKAEMAKLEAEEEAFPGPGTGSCGPCGPQGDPELVDDDDLYSSEDHMMGGFDMPHTGYGGGVTDKIEGDDYYPHDDSNRQGAGGMNVASPGRFGKKSSDVEFNFENISTESSSEEGFANRDEMWRALKEL